MFAALIRGTLRRSSSSPPSISRTVRLDHRGIFVQLVLLSRPVDSTKNQLLSPTQSILSSLMAFSNTLACGRERTGQWCVVDCIDMLIFRPDGSVHWRLGAAHCLDRSVNHRRIFESRNRFAERILGSLARWNEINLIFLEISSSVYMSDSPLAARLR